MQRSVNSAIVRLVLALFIPFSVHGQYRTTLPDGNPVRGFYEGNGSEVPAFYWSDHAIFDHRSGVTNWMWDAPPGTTIKDVAHKRGGQSHYVLLSDGRIFRFEPVVGFVDVVVEYPRVSTSGDTGEFSKLVADDLYAVREFVWVSRADSTVWSLDSAGMGFVIIRAMALDSSGNVYAATGSGLYFQGHTDSVWTKNATLTPTSLRGVFVDRLDRIYVGSSSGVYFSTDAGISWTAHTSGMGSLSVTVFADGSDSTIYAITNGALKLYRSIGGIEAWTRIDASLLALAEDQSAALFNGLLEDSLLFVATSLGPFKSSDKGDTWSAFSDSPEALQSYGLLKLPSGRLVTGTDLGVYTSDDDGESWTRRYPSTTYVKNAGLARILSGDLFAVANGAVQKSTDNGSSWSLDISGLSSLGTGILYIDETGTQHYLLTNSVSTPRVYVRSGGAWISDVGGIAATSNSGGQAILSDGLGGIYFSAQYFTGPRVWRRSIGGGSWTADTTGLGTSSVMAFACYPNGALIAGRSGNGIYRRASDTWTALTSPSAVSTREAYLLSVDSSGTLFAAYRGYTNFQRAWHGIYASTDTGATWQYVGNDSVEVTGMVSYGDTTYVLTPLGAYLVNASGPLAVELTSFTASVEAGSVLLKWTTSTETDNVGWEVERRAIANGELAIANFQKIGFVEGSETSTSARKYSFTDHSLFQNRQSTILPAIILAGDNRFAYRLRQLDRSGAFTYSHEAEVEIGTVAREFTLSDPYPNPFNPGATVEFSVPVDGKVTLEIIDMLGRVAATIVDEEKKGGFVYRSTFDASRHATGAYFLRLRATGGQLVKKILLVK